MQTVLALALTLLTPIAYFAGLAVLGVHRAVPVFHLAISGVGVAWLVYLALKADSKKSRLLRGLAGGLGLLWLVGFAWYLFDYSNYEAGGESREARSVPALASLTLADHTGAERPWLDAPQAKATLLVLYRGYW